MKELKGWQVFALIDDEQFYWTGGEFSRFQECGAIYQDKSIAMAIAYTLASTKSCVCGIDHITAKIN